MSRIIVRTLAALALFITGLVALPGAAAAPVHQVQAAPVIAGSSASDWYYQRYSPYICGFRISGTNYDNNAGGQTYHIALQSLDAGYSPMFWSINGGAATYRYAHGFYYNVASRTSDHSFRVYVRTPSGGTCTIAIYASQWA